MQTIQYLITLSPSQTVVQQLSQMLRYSLRTNSHTVELNEELNYIEQYVAIQNIRFDDMIKLHIESSEEARHQTIGKMMLQPLKKMLLNMVEILSHRTLLYAEHWHVRIYMF